MKYIIDSNVLIVSARRLYPKDVFASFWSQMESHIRSGEIVICNAVQQEISKGNDDLKNWLLEIGKTVAPEKDSDSSVVSAYSEMIQGISESGQYSESAKQEFAKVDIADAWIIAHAKAFGYTVVTEEAYSSDSKSHVKIPNVCQKENVQCIKLIDMLRALKFRF